MDLYLFDLGLNVGRSNEMETWTSTKSEFESNVGGNRHMTEFEFKTSQSSESSFDLGLNADKSSSYEKWSRDSEGYNHSKDLAEGGQGMESGANANSIESSVERASKGSLDLRLDLNLHASSASDFFRSANSRSIA
ncbi:hypothetical protein [Paenibacillus sp. B01]|uniref:hypothetical protein n=1 Tax=Paenibacillus sp. B01 TaxID=2660554 RepID=UPI00129AE46B|nr:hypothetical protein [Paenibacillus sp. B01]QGG57872.1 hypothetical protein GE073_21420 [Paenibacillus sp. B01]